MDLRIKSWPALPASHIDAGLILGTLLAVLVPANNVPGKALEDDPSA